MPIHFVELAGLWDLMPVYAVVMLEVSKALEVQAAFVLLSSK